MSSLQTVDLDFVAELRLRQWARQNYLPIESRNDSEWHPVVLDEMRRKDRELKSQSDAMQTVVTSAGIVPLELSRHAELRFDGPQANVPAPMFHREPSRQTQNEPFIAYYA